MRYYASDMVLWVDSDASYLAEPEAKSRIAGFFHLSQHPNITSNPNINGPIHVECKSLRHVVTSAAEAEIAGVFHNVNAAMLMRHMLNELHHPQPPTRVKTENSSVNSFAHNNIQQKCSKSWDMRYHWLKEKQTQQKFKIYWDQGTNNHADPYTKHHPTKHHLDFRAKQ